MARDDSDATSAVGRSRYVHPAAQLSKPIAARKLIYAELEIWPCAGLTASGQNG